MSQEDAGDDGTVEHSDNDSVIIDDSLASRISDAYDDFLDDEGLSDDAGDEDLNDDGDHTDEVEKPSRRTQKSSDRSTTKQRDESETFSQMKLNVSRQARQLSEANRTIKDLQSKIETFNKTSSNSEPADVIELVRSWAAKSLGISDMNDPRIMQALAEAATDLTIEGYEDARNDPALKDRAERIKRERELRDHKRSVDKQFEEIRAEKARMQSERQQAEMVNIVADYVESISDDFPFMTAAGEAGDIDPTQLLFQAAIEAVRSGQAPDPRDESELQDLIFNLANNVEQHYKNVAEALSSRTKNSQTVRKSSSDLSKNVRKANDRSERGKTSTRENVRDRSEAKRDVRRSVNTGGGGKGRPAPAVISDDERDDLSSRITRFRKYGR